MTTAVTNELIYAVLQKMQGDMAGLRLDMGELRARMTASAAIMGNMLLQTSGLNRRLDRVEERLSRVERRLELTDHR